MAVLKTSHALRSCHLPACFSLELDSHQMAGIRNEETGLLEPSPSCLIYTCVNFEGLRLLKDSFKDCNRTLVLERVIPDHASFARIL